MEVSSSYNWKTMQWSATSILSDTAKLSFKEVQFII